MPRSSGGTYTLYTPGNPVVTNTVISSTWANNTLTDLATAMTDSLSRSGQGGMTAPLQLFAGTVANPGLTFSTETTAGLYRAGAGDFRFAVGGTDVFLFATGGSTGRFGNGTVGAPAISWVSETNSGMYRNGAGDFRWSIGGTDFMTLNANLLQIGGTGPAFRLNETDATANNRLWNFMASGEDLALQAMTDAGVGANFLAVTRTAGAVDTMSFGNATNNPTYTFLGSGVLTANGQAVLAGAPTNSLAASLRIQHSSNPILALYQSGAGADAKLWDFVPVSGQLLFRTATDAGAGNVNWLEVSRSGTTPTIVNFPNGTLQYGGLEVGYRNLIHRSFSGNDSSAASDRGRAVQYTGTGGHTFTFDTDLGTNHIVTIMNMGNGNLTIAETLSGTMGWMNGSGTISSGSRTLAVAGIATVWYQDASNCFIWGTGLS